jgi:hypothetical protein
MVRTIMAAGAIAVLAPTLGGMTDRRHVLVGGLVIVAVIVIGGLAAATTRRPAVSPASPEPSVAEAIGQAASGTSRDGTPHPSAMATDSAAPIDATPTPNPTPRALTTADPRLAYAEFLLRANDDRTTVETMNSALAAGVEAQDRAAVRRAAVDILDFVDSERDWLREHPPAACYAEAHDAAGAMLAAYGTAADRFIAWTDAAPGLDSLAALARAAEAAQTAGDALTAFGRTLEAIACP